MTEQTLVHVMRHGEVDNPTGVLYGRLPGYVLSELGHKMAIAVAESVRGRDVVHVAASPLERAQQTAKPIAAEFGLTVQTDERLIEAQNVFEGLTFGVGDGSLRRPAHWKHLRNPFRPSWGEPYRGTGDPDARGHGRRARCGSRPGGDLRVAPAADLGGPLIRRGPPAVARPAQARVHAGVTDDLHLRG